MIWPTEGDGKCIVQHNVSVSQYALEEIPARPDGLVAVGVDAHDQFGIAGLDRRMDQIAGEHRGVGALAGADREMVGRVARGRTQSDMVVERMIAADQFGPVGLDDRQHAVGDLVERRLLMDLAPIGVFFFENR